ncbi:hypothetical protein SKAU_G00233330 [Synaphobranchus kaupii]|uniref:Uncharacterized protein n=1 Tax=Synaphobranchus kaupii TaxID=118154 RepID=A0A9Q1F613_SYNKA|nr:hypothetical protein SKAU_G00233330 [Synaphobranchus kaupii]
MAATDTLCGDTAEDGKDTQSDMYTLDQINEFLNETFGKPVKVKMEGSGLGLLRRAGRLGYDCQLFLMRPGVVDFSGLMPYYNSVIQAMAWYQTLRLSQGTTCPEGGGWRSASELAEVVGMRSTRLMQQLLEGIRAAIPASLSRALQRTFLLGKPGETGEEFPPVTVAAAYDD